MKTTTTNRSNRSRLPVSQFRPRNDEEHVIHEIARTLDEPYIDYLKSIYDRYGYDLIWDAWLEYREIVEQGAKFDNPRAFFNFLVEKRRPNYERK